MYWDEYFCIFNENVFKPTISWLLFELQNSSHYLAYLQENLYIYAIYLCYILIQSRFKSRLFGLHVLIAFFRK